MDYCDSDSNKTGYSIWILFGTMALLLLIGTFAFKQLLADSKMPKKISYLPKVPMVVQPHQNTKDNV